MTVNSIFKLLRIVVVFVLLGLISGCGATGSYIRQSILSSTQSETLQIGGSTYNLITYKTESANLTSPLRTLFYVGGSGCASLSVYLAPYFASLPAGFEVVALEKQGVTKSSLGTSCTDEFWNNYTYDKLIERNTAVLNFVKKRTSDGIFAIVGTSEGGPIALELAAHNSDISKVVVIAAGGMPQREELEVLAMETGTLHSIQEALKRVDEDPTNFDKRTLGFPNPYWASVLDRDPKTHIKKISQPVLIVIGEKDKNVPVLSAQTADNHLAQSELLIWPNADHIFKTPSGSVRDDVIRHVGQFLLQ